MREHGNFLLSAKTGPGWLVDNEFSPYFAGKIHATKVSKGVFSSHPFKIARKIYVYTSRRIVKYSRIISRGKRVVYTRELSLSYIRVFYEFYIISRLVRSLNK